MRHLIWLCQRKRIKKISVAQNMKSYKKPCKFDLELKGQCRMWIMNWSNTSPLVTHPCAKYDMPKQSNWSDKKTCQKPWSQRSTYRDHQYTRHLTSWWYNHMCQIWYANVKAKNITDQKWICTDRRTERQNNSYIPPKLRLQRYNDNQ